MPKTSIRFFNDREVRPIWNEKARKRFFFVPDVVGVQNGQNDYAKNRNGGK